MPDGAGATSGKHAKSLLALPAKRPVTRMHLVALTNRIGLPVIISWPKPLQSGQPTPLAEVYQLRPFRFEEATESGQLVLPIQSFSAYRECCDNESHNAGARAGVHARSSRVLASLRDHNIITPRVS